MSFPGSEFRAFTSTRLVGVELKNFKSIRAADVVLSPLTLIVGSNSAGKSSLIQAILAMTQVSRRRVEGRRFPLNDELVRLGTFRSLRHQGVNRDSAVFVGAHFRSDERDVRWLDPRLRRETAGLPAHRERGSAAQPVDLRWAVEVDSSVDDQAGSAQISAIEVAVSGGNLAISARIERTSERSMVRAHRDEIRDAVAFSGTIRSPDEMPVLDATISSGQVISYFGTPPEPSVRVRDWFRAIRELERTNEVQAAETESRERVIEQAAWAVARDVSASSEFVDWYLGLNQTAQEDVAEEVLTAYQADRAKAKPLHGGVERLPGRAPAWLTGAQRACSSYLADQVRYVGPLRQAPHQPFSAAPDPDAGDVGVSGQYVAAVLQAYRARTLHLPVPSRGERDGNRVERLTLGEAVNRWLRFFGLADSLTVREDTPLVLGIDLVPPGLSEPVPLGAVGVGVSQVLPVVVQCLVAGPDALVILEQPELHLHPAAQQLLADFLLACTAWGQHILVESHSEYLVLRLRRRIAEDNSDALLRQVAILFADRDAAGTTTYRQVELTETGGVVEWPDGFFDQGPDEAHQLLIAAADRQRREEGTSRAQ